jgi:hypothetical protein
MLDFTLRVQSQRERGCEAGRVRDLSESSTVVPSIPFPLDLVTLMSDFNMGRISKMQ